MKTLHLSLAGPSLPIAAHPRSPLRLLALAALFAMALLAAGCAAGLPDLTQAHGPCTDKPGGWCDFTRKAANDSFVYAALSNNAYCDETAAFALPPAYREVRREPPAEVCALERKVAGGDKTAKPALKAARKALDQRGKEALAGHGFAYAVYDKAGATGAPPAERIIAFRGTDAGQIADWIHGNFGKAQRRMAQKLYAQERARLDAEGGKGVPIRTTGHSLGGALALQVSVDHAGVDAFVFNPSPNYDFEPGLPQNRRLAVIERGEFLERLRKTRMPARQELVILNCAPGRDPFSAHSIHRMAECLTWIAAREKADARLMRSANRITDPPAGEVANRAWGLDPEPPEAELTGEPADRPTTVVPAGDPAG